MMIALIERVRERIAQGVYVNEAAISHGVVTPILNALGWDSADPDQMVPEFSVQRGRVDFALFGLGRRPGVFIEVKGIGRALDGDRQLFEYAFHQGVPLCVLTDGREWSFYVPSGQGSYEDRRVYRLQLDDREPEECARILNRYLARDRVRDGSAYEDAQRDYRDAAGHREAAATLPRAWAELVEEANELLCDTISFKAEALCGFKPSPADVVAFLQSLSGAVVGAPAKRRVVTPTKMDDAPNVSAESAINERAIRFTLFGQVRTCSNASQALVEILGAITARDLSRIPDLSAAVRTSVRSLIAKRVADINPARPDLARAAEFAPGWLVGLNVDNQKKMSIIRAACEIYGVSMPKDLEVKLPNAV